MLTVLGLQMGTMLGGTVLVEYVFNWPGLSTPLLRAVEARDYPMVVGIVLTISGLFLLINLVDGPALRRARSAGAARHEARSWLPGALVAADHPAGAAGAVAAACRTRSGRTSPSASPAPMPGSPLGRDEFGRDVLSRLIWGARTSLGVAFAAAAIAGIARHRAGPDRRLVPRASASC